MYPFASWNHTCSEEGREEKPSILPVFSVLRILFSLLFNPTLTIFPEYIKNYKLSNTETSQWINERPEQAPHKRFPTVKAQGKVLIPRSSEKCKIQPWWDSISTNWITNVLKTSNAKCRSSCGINWNAHALLMGRCRGANTLKTTWQFQTNSQQFHF